MINIIIDTIIDNIKLLPFLFIAFLIIELLEHKFSNHTKKFISKSGEFGPLIGSIVGVIPQCGFSAMATNLYVTRIISLGTLISVYLSTSDEMLPILLSEGASMGIILKILSIKVVVGIISGFIIDFIYRKNNFKNDYHICSDDECHCEDSIIRSCIKHTFNIWIFIFGVSFILNIIMYYIGDNILENIFSESSILSIFLASLVGLIPNCSASVILTELYINGVISLSSVIAGLLTGSGVAIIILFKSNKSLKENISIVFLIYLIGVISGLIINYI